MKWLRHPIEMTKEQPGEAFCFSLIMIVATWLIFVFSYMMSGDFILVSCTATLLALSFGMLIASFVIYILEQKRRKEVAEAHAKKMAGKK